MGPITIQHKIQTIILQHKDNYNTTQHTDMQPSYNTSYNNKIIKTIFIWHATQHTDNNSHTTLHTDNSHTTEHNDNHQSAYNTAHKKTIIIQHIWLRQSSDIIQVYIHRKTLHTLIDATIDVQITFVDHADIHPVTLFRLLLLFCHSSFCHRGSTCMPLHALFSKKQWDRYTFNEFDGGIWWSNNIYHSDRRIFTCLFNFCLCLRVRHHPNVDNKNMCYFR